MICSVCGVTNKNTYRRKRFDGLILCSKHNAQMERQGKISETTYKDPNKIVQYDGYIGVVLTDKQQNVKGEALISNDLAHLVVHRKWSISYGYAKSGWGGRGKSILMHRLLFSVPEGLFIDHINGNKLDNRSDNIRIVSKSQNAMNSKTPSNNPLGLKGVSFDKRRNKYRAYIKLDQKQIHLGHFSSIKDAIEARLMSEKNLFGEYSKGWSLAEVR